MMKLSMLCCVLVTLVPSAIKAQWVPINGQVITTTEAIAADGTVNSKWSTTSRYSRSASGSVLVQHIGRSGKPATATLLDYGNSKRIFSLSYHTGQVTDMHHPLDHQFAAAPPSGQTDAQRKVSQGNVKIDGVDCFIVPVYDTVANRQRILIGKAWLAPAYNNLVMREEVTRLSPTAGKIHVVRKFNVVDHKEPDASLFSIDRKVVASKWQVIAQPK